MTKYGRQLGRVRERHYRLQPPINRSSVGSVMRCHDRHPFDFSCYTACTVAKQLDLYDHIILVQADLESYMGDN